MSSAFLVEKIGNLKKLLMECEYYHTIVDQLTFSERVKVSALAQTQLNAYDIMKSFEKYWTEDQAKGKDSLFIFKEDKKCVIYNNITREGRLSHITEKYIKEEEREEARAKLFNLSCRILGYINLLHDFYVQNKEEVN